jgi:tetratricopeptide (TPR) repeat protein
MEHLNFDKKMNIRQIIARYEAMSQKGTVSFLEETVFLEMIDFCDTESKHRLALRISDDAITQHPFCVSLYLRKAHLLLNRHKIAESLVTIEQADLIEPHNMNVGLLHAELLAVQGQHKKALAILAELKGHASTEEGSELYLVEAQLFEDLGQHSKMFDALRKCLSMNCSNNEAYEKMIWATEYSQRYAESITFHNRLLDRNAYNWRAWLNLGFANEALEKYPEAIDAFEFAFAIDDKCRAAYMEAGELHIQLGEYQRAQYVYESAIFNTGEDALILQKLGFCAQKTENLQTAYLFYKRSLELNPNDAETYFHLGECYKGLGKWQKAIDVYLRAIAIDNRKEEFHAALAEAYWQTEQFGKALSSFRKAAITAPEDLVYWLRYAGFLFSVGQEKKALSVLQDAQNYVFGAEIEYCQIACLMSLGRRSEALYRLSEALAEDFDKHTTLLSWRPDLAENADFQNMINDYKP